MRLERILKKFEYWSSEKTHFEFWNARWSTRMLVLRSVSLMSLIFASFLSRLFVFELQETEAGTAQIQYDHQWCFLLIWDCFSASHWIQCVQCGRKTATPCSERTFFGNWIHNPGDRAVTSGLVCRRGPDPWFPIRTEFHEISAIFCQTRPTLRDQNNSRNKS